MKSTEEKVYDRLKNTIDTMKESCDSAYREIDRYKTDPLYNCERVLHVLTWGFANSQSEIETALAILRRDLEQKENESS